MQKSQFKLHIDAKVRQRLDSIGDRYGMSAAAIAAVACYELSRIRPDNLWHALARLAEDEEPLSLSNAHSLTGGEKAVQKRALKIVG